MNIYLLSVALFFFIIQTSSLYLSPKQYSSIRRIIQQPELSREQKNKLKSILYRAFEPWALRYANIFKHQYQLNHYSKDEIVQSAKIGLYKSLKLYNGISTLPYYASFYIKNELFDLITDKSSSSIIPKSLRKRNKRKFSKEESENYSQLMNRYSTHFSSKIEQFIPKQTNIVDRIILEEEKQELWRKINDLEPFVKRVFQLKYDIDFRKIRSMKEIAVLMSCSEEYVRVRLRNHTMIY